MKAAVKFGSRSDGFSIPVGKYIIDFGVGDIHYCSNRSHDVKDSPYWFCENGEIAIIEQETGDFVTGVIFEEMSVNWDNDGMVGGYITPKQFTQIFLFLANKDK